MNCWVHGSDVSAGTAFPDNGNIKKKKKKTSLNSSPVARGMMIYDILPETEKSNIKI
jgi:hypothetical protein